jgi:hypothetical protein
MFKQIEEAKIRDTEACSMEIDEARLQPRLLPLISVSVVFLPHGLSMTSTIHSSSTVRTPRPGRQSWHPGILISCASADKLTLCDRETISNVTLQLVQFTLNDYSSLCQCLNSAGKSGAFSSLTSRSSSINDGIWNMEGLQNDTQTYGTGKMLTSDEH